MRTALLRRRRLVDSVDPTFITTWQTTTAAESITLPLISSGTYDFEVDWGDGSSDVITAFDDPARIHTYAEAGVRDVRISGVCEGWNFGSVTVSRDNISDVKNWGSLNITTPDSFRSCSNLQVTAFDAPKITGTVSLFRSFQGTAVSESPSFPKWDVSQIQSIRSMFQAASSFNSDISGWDVSSVVTFESTFNSCAVFNQDISGWDVSSATTLGAMLFSCAVFNQDISGWDVSSASILINVLLDASSFNQNLGAWPLRRAGVDMTNALSGTALSPENYSRTLIGWANYVASSPGGPFDVPLGASGLTYNDTVYEPGATYSNAVDARNYLTTATLDGGAGWTITDGGLAT